jgi:anti-sigma-K factor RskA
MTERDDDRDALAAEYVLGLLEGTETLEAERRIADDADFADAVQAWRRRLADLDTTVAPRPVGEAMWARIAGDLGLRPTVAGPVRPATASRAQQPGFLSQLWQSLAFWRGLSAAAVAAAVALVVVFGLAPREDQPAFVAVLMTDAGRPGAVMHAYADGRVTLVPLEVAPIPQGRSLQLWSISAASPSPVAVGLMDQVRTIRLDLRRLSPAQLRETFAISVEPAGGSPTGLPTGPVVMQGAMKPAN